ncbi:MAG TPA: hypothetical protein VH107_12175 [Lacipirellulaceae bacterium]|jgi:hypothetical protein|nr:hypothetical protein [Lacipirellulaceae bacterium]
MPVKLPAVTEYFPGLLPLLAGNRRRALDGGIPDADLRPALQILSASTAFEHVSSHSGGRRQPADPDMAACCIAAVWLLHDFLDESHAISQSIDTAEGNYWHAVMHRREGDFSNSKYWYRHVGNHPVYAALAETCHREWEPFAFVDECQAVARGKSESRDLCLDLQQVEWEVLFDYCYRNAIGH